MAPPTLLDVVEECTGTLTARQIRRLSSMQTSEFGRICFELRDRLWRFDAGATIPERNGSGFRPYIYNYSFYHVLQDMVPNEQRRWGRTHPDRVPVDLRTLLLYLPAIAVDDPVVQVVGGQPYWSRDALWNGSEQVFAPSMARDWEARRLPLLAALKFLANYRPLIKANRLVVAPLGRHDASPTFTDGRQEYRFWYRLRPDIFEDLDEPPQGRCEDDLENTRVLADLYERLVGADPVPDQIVAREELWGLLFKKWYLGGSVDYSALSPLQTQIMRWWVSEGVWTSSANLAGLSRLTHLAGVEVPALGRVPQLDYVRFAMDDTACQMAREAVEDGLTQIALSIPTHLGDLDHLGQDILEESLREATARLVDDRPGSRQTVLSRGAERFSLSVITASSTAAGTTVAGPVAGVAAGASSAALVAMGWALMGTLGARTTRRRARRVLRHLDSGTSNRR